MTREGKRFSAGAALAGILIGAVLMGRCGLGAPEAADGAKVVVLEFSDYQCPACKKAQEPLKKVLSHFGKDVKLVHKHFPLKMHRWARDASRSAVCAERQGRFKAYNDLLFEKQEAWSKSKDAPAVFREYALGLDLDGKAYDECLKDPAVDRKIDAHVREGLRLQVRSTPTFFVNKQRLAGARQLRLQGPQMIEKELRK